MSDDEQVTYITPATRLYPNMDAGGGVASPTLWPTMMLAHEENAIARPTAVRQARQVERTSESIRGGINRKVNMLVGADLRPQLMPDYRALGLSAEWADEFATQGENLFRSWANDRRMIADTEGHYGFGGLMWMAARNLNGPDGETFGVIHYDVARARRLGTRWATTVTVLDPMRVETPPQHAMRPEVVEGKLVDNYGRMLGFYFRKESRDPLALDALSYQYAPRFNPRGRPMGWHFFSKHRGGVQRGITQLVNTLSRVKMLDKFDSATLGAAIVAAAMATYVKTAGSSEDALENLAPVEDGPAGGDAFGDRLAIYDKLKLRIGPQRIPVLPTADEIIIAAADRATADPSKFRRGFHNEFASALGMTGEQLSLDYSQVNYSSARAALIDIWRGVLAERHLFAQSVAAPVVEAVIEEAIVKGWIVLPPNAPDFYEHREAYTRCLFTGPALGWVDPKKEAEAADIRVGSCLSTLSDEAQSQGKSFDEIAEQRARELRKLRALGIEQEEPKPATTLASDDDDDDEPEDDDTNTDPPESSEE